MLGESVLESTMTETIIRNNFSIDAALNELLTQQGKSIALNISSL